MKILLISQSSPYLELMRGEHQPFAPHQVQMSWFRTLKAMHHRVEVFRFSDSIFFSTKFSARIQYRLHCINPSLYSKVRLLKNRSYHLFPDSHIRARHLGQLILRNRPDLIILTGGVSELTPAPFRLAKSLNIPTVLFHGVNPDQMKTRFTQDTIKYFDWVITNDPVHAQKWREIGAAQALALPYAGVDLTLHRRLKLTPAEKKMLGAGVVFIGTLEPERQAKLLSLTHFPLKIYGYLPPKISLHPRLQPFYHGQSWGEHSVRVYNASQIVLNFVPSHMPTGGNLRTFEIPGSGAFQLANRCHPSWFVRGKEIELFKSPGQLISQIQYYLDHPAKRNQIARNGFARTRKSHTYQHRFHKLFKLIGYDH